MNVSARIKSAWKSAQLLIAFHSNPNGGPRAEPRLWSSKNNVAGVTDDPKTKEAFVVVRGQGDAGDVQIKFHPENIILRRDEDALGWTGIRADHYGVSVLVGNVWVTVNAEQLDHPADPRQRRGHELDRSRWCLHPYRSRSAFPRLR